LSEDALREVMPARGEEFLNCGRLEIPMPGLDLSTGVLTEKAEDCQHKHPRKVMAATAEVAEDLR
jgi:hypothetical protein